MRARMPLALAAATALLLRAVPADAGCGCDKPPPPTTSIRPAFASPGGTITLFAPRITAGNTYRVVFGNGSKAPTVTVKSVVKRDLADGVQKPQLRVAVPKVPVGPTRVQVFSGSTRVLDVPPDNFTMLQPVLALPEADSDTVAIGYRAAVSKQGVVYIPLDISAIAQHMIFAGLGKRFPLMFGAQDVAIYNTQGFLMQLLGPDQAAIYAIDDDEGYRNSFKLTYDRHEFMTYRQQHKHLLGLGLDPTDPWWHTDGTYHVDHDHLVIAIHGELRGKGSPPQAGQTSPFDLHVTTALGDGSAGTVVTQTIYWAQVVGAKTVGLGFNVVNPNADPSGENDSSGKSAEN